MQAGAGHFGPRITVLAVITGYVAACAIVALGLMSCYLVFRLVGLVFNSDFVPAMRDTGTIVLSFFRVTMILFLGTLAMAFPGFLFARLAMYTVGRGGAFLFAVTGAVNGLAVILALNGFSFHPVLGPIFVALGAVGGATAWRVEQRTLVWGAMTLPALPTGEGPL